MLLFLSKLLLPLLLFSTEGAVDVGLAHPFHVSSTTLSYNVKSKSVEVTCRIFTDDLEEALFRKYGGKIDLIGKQKEMAQLVKKYLNEHLILSWDGQVSQQIFIGYENDHEATLVYFEAKKIDGTKQLQIKNSILYDLFDDQMNIVHFQINGKRQSSSVNYPKKEIKFSL